MHIPSCINLRQDQIDKLQKWHKSLPKQTIDAMEVAYGGACITSSIVFKIRNTSICTEIYAFDEHSKQKCNLTINDDNELID